MRHAEARYEEGLLRPTEPLALRPGEPVHLIVIRRPDSHRWNLGRLAGSAAGGGIFSVLTSCILEYRRPAFGFPSDNC
jgi:predicted DNA-binding antitoxin AbrB/MazE fold protein